MLKSLKCGELFPHQEINCMESSLLIYTMFYIDQGGQDIEKGSVSFNNNC